MKTSNDIRCLTDIGPMMDARILLYDYFRSIEQDLTITYETISIYDLVLVHKKFIESSSLQYTRTIRQLRA